MAFKAQPHTEPFPGELGSQINLTGDPVQDLTLESAVEMQDLLIKQYMEDEFQEKLHKLWAAAGGNEVSEMRVRQELCLPIQVPVIQRFGFEATRKGVALSVRAFIGKPWSAHEDIQDRNKVMAYLVNPSQQNNKWINGFDKAPDWWQRSRLPTRRPEQEGISTSPSDPSTGPFAKLSEVPEGVEESTRCLDTVNLTSLTTLAQKDSTVASSQEIPTRQVSSHSMPRWLPEASRQGPGHKGEQLPASSIDDVIKQLSRLQIMSVVPLVSHIRSVRPLQRCDHELYSAQFVLQSSTGDFNMFLHSAEGKTQFHPFLSPSQLPEKEDSSFKWLDDKVCLLYQTNGIARAEETILSKPIRCRKTGAPGHYIETKILVARRRGKGTPGKYASGLKAAQSFKTMEDVEANLFYSWTGCWQIYACVAPVGELGEEDVGERILIRRSIKDFTQHYFHDFPVAKHLTELVDKENEMLIKAFSLGSSGSLAESLRPYQCFTLRSWRTYESEEKAPEEDAGVRLVDAARNGRADELRRLVFDGSCDCDTIIAEFGAIGTGRNGYFTRCELGFAEERTALIAAVEAGYLSVVEVIIEFAKEGKANLDVVCHEWNPSGIGGECLRGNYTALDQACLYHRDEIQAVLLKARARRSKDAVQSKPRANPFDVRMRQDRGEYENSGWKKSEHEDRYADFTFALPGEEVQIDEETRGIIQSIKLELKSGHDNLDYNRHFKRLCLRWHPDKHPDERKALATRVFQWLQRSKVDSWESKAWTA